MGAMVRQLFASYAFFAYCAGHYAQGVCVGRSVAAGDSSDYSGHLALYSGRHPATEAVGLSESANHRIDELMNRCV